jgi:integrase/recombinase XerD
MNSQYSTPYPIQPSSSETTALNPFVLESHLVQLKDAFITDRKSQNLTDRSIKFYEWELARFLAWCESQGFTRIDQLSPDSMRAYLLHLAETGRNAGGVHAGYRTIRALFKWYEQEYEPTAWQSPLRNVKPPRVDIEPLDPVRIEDVRAMVATCNRGRFNDFRDKAIMLFMYDTGVRAGELLALNQNDVDTNGGVLIRQSKSRKPRTVFLGRESRRALRAYLRQRTDDNPAMFITDDIERLKLAGLRQILLRRAKSAKVKPPSCHAFRRANALELQRGGTDLITIQRLLGHADINQLERYLKQDADDLRIVHNRASPADAV